MNRSLIGGTVAALVLSAGTVVFGQTITLVNSGFESPDVAAGGFNNSDPIPGFDKGPDVGVQNFGDFGAPAGTAGVTDGDQAVFLGNFGGGTNIFQDVTVSGIMDGSNQLNLTVALASRGGGADAPATAGVNFGIQNRTNDGMPANFTFVPLTTLQTGATPGDASASFQNFSVTLNDPVDNGDVVRVFIDKIAGSPLVLADNLRLSASSAIPEPASLGLLGLGGVALLRRRR